MDWKPHGTGQEAKTLSATDVNVITTLEQVRSADIADARKYSKEYGKAAGTVMRLCEEAGIIGTNRVVVANSWFANLSLV